MLEPRYKVMRHNTKTDFEALFNRASFNLHGLCHHVFTKKASQERS